MSFIIFQQEVCGASVYHTLCLDNFRPFQLQSNLLELKYFLLNTYSALVHARGWGHKKKIIRYSYVIVDTTLLMPENGMRMLKTQQQCFFRLSLHLKG